jgi:cation diffusion facilitator CzcD-associated flavoprotein CzcO
MSGGRTEAATYDAIVIGAGIAGMYQLHRLRGLGLRVRVLEAGDGVGGTWYWNRYPGARFDSESWTYGYSFSEEILREWEWSEHFAPQPETLRYCNFVADKLDLRRDIELGCRVAAAVYDEAADEWAVESTDGRRMRARLLIPAIGPLSAPTMPTIPGVESFRGEAHHTGRWPHKPVSFASKRVAVIGTGATAVQAITEIAKTVGHLTVFQRTPNWCAPLHNRPIDASTQARIKATYPETFAICRESFGCFIHQADPRNALEVSPEEREAFYERLYREPGFGTRRVPLESGYYEVYNQPNVRLVDIRETPIERITPAGIRTTAEEHAVDMIIYATGFDAITGAFDRIDIRGRGGRRLKEKWADGPRTFLGLQVEGFPNLFTLVGPHNAATFCNIPRCIEQNVEWVTALIAHMRARGHVRVEPTAEAEREWTQHVLDTGRRMLFTQVDSWMTGINSNVAGKDKRTFIVYAGGAPKYRERCDDVAARGYAGFVFRWRAPGAPALTLRASPPRPAPPRALAP